jgi:hypothetical protein
VEQQETGEQSLIGAARWAMHIINNYELTNTNVDVREKVSFSINGAERMKLIATDMNGRL